MKKLILVVLGFIFLNISSAKAAPTLSFSINRTVINAEQSVTLTWSTTGVNHNCYTSGDWWISGQNVKPPNGIQTVTPGVLEPAGTTKTFYTYGMECFNSVGVSTGRKTVSVTVNPPVLTMSVSPSTVRPGAGVTITWNSTNNSHYCWVRSDIAPNWTWNVSSSDPRRRKAPSGSEVIIPYYDGFGKVVSAYLECVSLVGISSGIRLVSFTVDPYDCVGETPANADLCTGDLNWITQDTTKIVVSSCTPEKKCEYVCKSGYIKSGNSCVPIPPPPSSFSCSGGNLDADLNFPINAVVCPGDTEDLSADFTWKIVGKSSSNCTLSTKCEYYIPNEVCGTDHEAILSQISGNGPGHTKCAYPSYILTYLDSSAADGTWNWLCQGTGDSSAGDCWARKCIPDCSCAAKTCSGQTCSDGCVGTCVGTLTDTVWTPDPSTVCAGVSFTQTGTSCGTTRIATGTKTCSGGYCGSYSYSCSAGNVFNTYSDWYSNLCSGGLCSYALTIANFCGFSQSCGTEQCTDSSVWRERCKDGDVWEFQWGKDDSCSTATGCDANIHHECSGTERIKEDCESGTVCKMVTSVEAECSAKASTWTED